MISRTHNKNYYRKLTEEIYELQEFSSPQYNCNANMDTLNIVLLKL
jgi:hypothetical protein